MVKYIYAAEKVNNNGMMSSNLVFFFQSDSQLWEDIFSYVNTHQIYLPFLIKLPEHMCLAKEGN